MLTFPFVPSRFWAHLKPDRRLVVLRWVSSLIKPKTTRVGGVVKPGDAEEQFVGAP